MVLVVIKQKINNILNSLTKKYSISLWQLDGVLGEIAGNGPFNRTADDINYVKERKKHGLTEEEIIQEIIELLSDKSTVERVPLRKRYAEVIISESLVNS